ncbi:MAG: M15 family metallopeptidase, partial [Deltaproteobacteria bacterium]|nr:M15 family metallopeptidase [Deltaproteobacteria bacterium]
RDGTTIPWDDGRRKDADEALEDPDLEDTFRPPYPAGAGWRGPPAEGHDPGRARHDGLLAGLYGRDRKAVEARLVRVPWMPGFTDLKVRVHGDHGVADAVRRVSEELARLPEPLRRLVLAPTSWNWRSIHGTTRLSAHARGIAIDLAMERASYWRWDLKEVVRGLPPWRNTVPMEIVEVFERHGFIWGGKWRHYDTMHFEYRPELLHPRCAASTAAQTPGSP